MRAWTATLDEQGYEMIEKLESTASMKVFVMRLASQIGLEIVEQESLGRWSSQLSGQMGTKKYASVVHELSAMSQLPDHWIRKRVTVGGVPPSRSADLVENDDAPMMTHAATLRGSGASAAFQSSDQDGCPGATLPPAGQSQTSTDTAQVVAHTAYMANAAATRALQATYWNCNTAAVPLLVC